TSGSSYVNFGWALTPQPAAIPTDGSTLLVWVDGLPLGHPTYNQYRPDIATLFPGYANSDGAVGFFYLNPSTLSEGTHSLSWSVEDSLGRLNGIGSRYFSVEHPSGGVHTGTARRAPTMDVPTIDPPMQMLVHRGFAGTRETVHPDGEGGFFLKTEINQPLRIELGRSPQGIWSGLERVLGQPRPLPVGSRFDAQTGTFSWLPGPGFAGDFCLEFAASAGRVLCVRVRVKPGASGGGR
ncbi:MAG TPA: hypothetical protein PKK12_09150, partial [Candidatus Aminicenantes bacterium]|nr:hypothetical protein [Candidatus Aminicenantes bacterium]